MEARTLMDLMVEMERSLRNRDCTAAFSILLEAEECLLRMERELLTTETEKLRRTA